MLLRTLRLTTMLLDSLVGTDLARKRRELLTVHLGWGGM